MTYIKLNNGLKMPQLGLGVFRNPDGEKTENSVKWALEAGYRHIDTAMIYKNEKSVGKAIKESKVPREEIFLTTKLWNDDIRKGRTREAFEESLKKLKTDYIDLYLIHWPVVGSIEAYKVMEQLYKEKKIKAIGVSNFTVGQLKELISQTDIIPSVNQIEVHPYLENGEVVNFCQKNGIAVTAYKPIGGGDGDLLKNPILVNISKEHEKSPAQISLRWGLQRGLIVIPKSTHKNRITENLNVFDFKLTKEEMKQIGSLNKNQRFSPDSDNFDF